MRRWRKSVSKACSSGGILRRRPSFSIDAISPRFRLPRMIKSGSFLRVPAIGAKIRSLVRLHWIFTLVLAVLVTVAATPPNQQNPDEQYIHIMALIDRGDALRKAGQADAAKAKYKEAQR